VEDDEHRREQAHCRGGVTPAQALADAKVANTAKTILRIAAHRGKFDTLGTIWMRVGAG